MGSFLVWRKDTKAIHCCMCEAKGTKASLRGLVSHIRADWSTFYASAEISSTLNTLQAKEMYYVDQDDVPQLRQEMPITYDTLSPVISGGEAVTTLSDVPIGAEVFIDGESIGTTTESDVELVFDLEGDYAVVLTLYPYLDWKETVHATA